MDDHELETIKNSLIDRATECYYRQTIDADRYKAYLGDIYHNQNQAELEDIANSLNRSLAVS
jgi:hypothetical protein